MYKQWVIRGVRGAKIETQTPIDEVAGLNLLATRCSLTLDTYSACAGGQAIISIS